MRVFLWNLRFRIGHAILPGSHKHVTVAEGWKDCSKCR